MVKVYPPNVKKVYHGCKRGVKELLTNYEHMEGNRLFIEVVLIQQFISQLPQRHGQIDVGAVRVFQAERLLPERSQLLFTVFLDVHNLGRLIDAPAL